MVSRNALNYELSKPLQLEDCSHAGTCNGCAASISCGWCNGSCLDIRQLSACSIEPILETESCNLCSSHMDCVSCIETDCMWLGNQCKSTLSGVPSNAIIEEGLCPEPCHSRQTCQNCLVTDAHGQDNCGWCSSTASCFDFGVYTSMYTFGQCSR